MSAGGRLAAFAAVVLAVGGGAAAVGSAVDERVAAPGGHGESHGGGDAYGAEPAPPGLRVEAEGLRLALERTTLPPGRQTLRLRLVDEDGRPVRDLEVAHEKRLHLIVVRRDMTGFQHLHPVERADGTWETTAELGEAGTWRVFADVTRDGEQATLGADLHVPGDFAPRPLPAPQRVAVSDGGLRVTATELSAERAAFAADAPLQPYLGAAGHLVALRAGDLTYAHTHPEGDRPAFGLELPGPGTYRLFLQVRSGGRVHTTAFTHRVTS